MHTAGAAATKVRVVDSFFFLKLLRGISWDQESLGFADTQAVISTNLTQAWPFFKVCYP